MSDIVERLRESPLPSLNRIVRDRKDAADEITCLRTEIARLKSEQIEVHTVGYPKIRGT